MNPAGQTTRSAIRIGSRRDVAPSDVDTGVSHPAPVGRGCAVLLGALPLAISCAWLALALRAPHSTFHLAPFLAAASWPIALRRRSHHVAPAGAAAMVAAGSLLITLVAAATLGLEGALGGPSIWHGSGALEALLLAPLGAAWGWRAATRRHLGLLRLIA